MLTSGGNWIYYTKTLGIPTHHAPLHTRFDVKNFSVQEILYILDLSIMGKLHCMCCWIDCKHLIRVFCSTDHYLYLYYLYIFYPTHLITHVSHFSNENSWETSCICFWTCKTTTLKYKWRNEVVSDKRNFYLFNLYNTGERKLFF